MKSINEGSVHAHPAADIDGLSRDAVRQAAAQEQERIGNILASLGPAHRNALDA